MLRIYNRLNQKTAIQFIDYVLENLPFHVESIQTDKGSEFQSSFHWHVLDRGIRHVYIRPLTPRLNGKVERSHRIDGEEFYRMLDGVVVDDSELFAERLQEWEDYYNYDRPHGGLGGQTPYERLRQKTKGPEQTIIFSSTSTMEWNRAPHLYRSRIVTLDPGSASLVGRCCDGRLSVGD